MLAIYLAFSFHCDTCAMHARACTHTHTHARARAHTHACVHTHVLFFFHYILVCCACCHLLQVSLVSLVVLGIHLALSFIMTCVVLAATLLEVSFVMLAIHLALSFIMTCRHTCVRTHTRSFFFFFHYFLLRCARCHFKYRWYRLSCLEFIWHFLSSLHAGTHTHTHTNKQTHIHTHAPFFLYYWCVVLAATDLKYRLSCLPFIWHFLSL